MNRNLRILMLSSLMLLTPPTRGDEGMYLFNDLPRKHLKEKHNFEPSVTWARDLQLASVRFNSGGSGSFVSSGGLVLTNHHVASDTLAKLSTPDRNLIEDGFHAETFDEELKAPDLELNQLVEMIDVTDQINASVTAIDDPDEAARQRRAVIATVEKDSLDKTGLRSDVVTLFGGAKYHLYRYKKYTDVRLVWAPETAAAFFGGDADNFEYPRYNLDATLMRVYENGEPAKLNHYLRWSPAPVAAGDLVFVSGHPGRTQRIFTVEALEYLRDVRLPYVLNLLRRKEILIQQYRLENLEASRRGRDELFGLQNSRKAYTGMLAGLQDPSTISAKRGRQDRILQRLSEHPDAELAMAWDEIKLVMEERAALLGKSVTLRSELFGLALQIYLLKQEDRKPNEQRLREFSDAGRDSLLTQLLSPAPIYEDLERVKLADELSLLIENRGMGDSLVAEVLLGRSPRQAAADLVAGTEANDPEVRRNWLDDRGDRVEVSDDPMLELARTLVPEIRRIRDLEDSLDEREKQAYAKITRAMIAIEGTGGYPDATFTLRLAFGTVAGYQEDGHYIAPTTTFGGAFAHASQHVSQPDFELPVSWQSAQGSLELATQLNFVCTADIIGGNSGSPVVDRAGQLVGLVFDGNIQSLVSDYLYTDEQGRAVCVSAVAIKEALTRIYQASDLAQQLGH